METSPDTCIASYYKIQPIDYPRSFANQDSLKTSKGNSGPDVPVHSVDQKQQ